MLASVVPKSKLPTNMFFISLCVFYMYGLRPGRLVEAKLLRDDQRHTQCITVFFPGLLVSITYPLAVLFHLSCLSHLAMACGILRLSTYGLRLFPSWSENLEAGWHDRVSRPDPEQTLCLAAGRYYLAISRLPGPFVGRPHPRPLPQCTW